MPKMPGPCQVELVVTVRSSWSVWSLTRWVAVPTIPIAHCVEYFWGPFPNCTANSREAPQKVPFGMLQFFNRTVILNEETRAC